MPVTTTERPMTSTIETPLDTTAILAQLAELQRRKAKLLATAIDCSPGMWGERRIANIEKPVFVEQLKLIECKEVDILNAVREFLRSNASRLEWYQKRYVTEDDVSEYEKKLTYIHKQVFNRPHDQAKTDVEHGQETLRLCKKDGLQALLDDRQPYAAYAEGTYHKLADAGVLGWHPKWQSKFGRKEGI